jgi:hypothetical protein
MTKQAKILTDAQIKAALATVTDHPILDVAARVN